MHTGIEKLIHALCCLPGVGPKSAQRMAYHLLQSERHAAKNLGESLLYALDTLQHCTHCNNFCEGTHCDRCVSTHRDRSQLCIVETPVDMNRVEQTQAYRGLYYVLMGRISPLDGHDADKLCLDRLLTRALDGQVSEVILASNFTNEGDLTAHYIHALFKERGIAISRIARGIPVGGELEYVDSNTLAQALRERRPY